MTEEWWPSILVLLLGALFLVGLVSNAQRSCEHRMIRCHGEVPIMTDTDADADLIAWGTTLAQLRRRATITSDAPAPCEAIWRDIDRLVDRVAATVPQTLAGAAVQLRLLAAFLP